MSSKTKPFSILEQNIDLGTYLIEASAGTGKTYNIQHLFLRLLLERWDIENVDSILVVTFTELATAELKERIRKNIAKACSYLESELVLENFDFKGVEEYEVDEIAELENTSLDPILIKLLIKTTNGDPEKIRKLHKKLLFVLHRFDQAAIFTIHGFCYRLLNDNAFEADCLFDAQLIEDESSYIQEVVQDFWRKKFYNISPLYLAVAKTFEVNLSTLFQLAKMYVQKNDVEPVPLNAVKDEEALYSKWQEIYKEWKKERQNILELLKSKKNKLSRKEKAYKSERIDQDTKDLDAMSVENPAVTTICRYAKSVLDQNITPSQKEKGVTALPHRFFDLCDVFYYLASQYALGLKLDLWKYVVQDRALELFKNSYKVQSFNDLLLKVRRALQDKNGFPNPESMLAKQIRKKYKAALIDEFQDTDPVQYEIFQTIFDYPSRLLFMIGDPKQSIYAFRGADIFSYLYVSSQEHIKRRTLAYNYRCSEGIQEAINDFFSTHQNPFLFNYKDEANLERGIQYSRIKVGKTPDYYLNIQDGTYDVPMQFGWLSAPCGGAINKKDAYQYCYKYVATKIAQILNLAQTEKAIFYSNSNDNNACIPVRPKDIAVLVLTNEQAFKMQSYLQGKGVPSVLQSSGNLFQTQEALEVLRVLQAVLQPNNKSYLLTALSTSLFDLDAATIVKYNESKEFQEEFEWWISLFSEYRRIWIGQGFIQMFRRLMQSEPLEILGNSTIEHENKSYNQREKSLKLKKDVAANLLKQSGGERKLTNVRHLMEILQQTSAKENLNPEGLLKWLAVQIKDPETKEEHELRLEKDSEAVQILTVHKSKGLEFPIVFCPFMWSRGFRLSNYNKKSPYIFHSARNFTPSKTYLALSPEAIEEFSVYRDQENLAESLRLLYVALTRAKHRLYLLWGNIRQSEDTALMYLRKNSCELIEEFFSYVANLNKDNIKDQVDYQSPSGDNTSRCWEDSNNIHRFEFYESENEIRYASETEYSTLQVDKLPDDFFVPFGWGIMSFSHFAGQLQRRIQIEEKASDEDYDYPPETSTSTTNLPFLDFPEGRTTGNAIHEILQLLDYTKIQGIDFNHWSNDPEIRELIVFCLQKYGLLQQDDENLEIQYKQVCDMLHRLMSIDFSLDSSNIRIRLNDPKMKRISEMNFFLSIPEDIDVYRLNKLLYSIGMQGIRSKSLLEDMISPISISLNNSCATRRGFLSGSIDLVFQYKGMYFFADWKTNRLGMNISDYTSDKLRQNMVNHAYILQYLIYTTALHKLLQSRLKDNYDYTTNFGGGFYFYLRGINGYDDRTGVFYERPSLDQINELEKVFRLA